MVGNITIRVDSYRLIFRERVRDCLFARRIKNIAGRISRR